MVRFPFGATSSSRQPCSVRSCIALPRARQACPSEAFFGGTGSSRLHCNLAIMLLDRADFSFSVQLPVRMVGAIHELPLHHIVPVASGSLLQMAKAMLSSALFSR